jgi:putative endonuclease
MTPKSSSEKGREGENAAARLLEEAGMRLVCRNFRGKTGEIDLIAEDGDCLVFVEVKNWPVHGIEDLAYSLSEKKKQRIIETAKYFLSINRKYNNSQVRFDVIFLNPGNPAERKNGKGFPRENEVCIRFESAFTET